jgi:myo-inositol-1(or 4)-monophosphatase
MIVAGEERDIIIQPHSDISTLFWTLGFRGRPALPTALVLEELIDRSSVDGGIFDLGSATYCITRLLTGQLDAYVDVGDRMIREAPQVEEHFLRAGHGHVLNNSSYDLAAAGLIAKEAGLAISDAFGKPLDGYPLLASGRAGQLSCVAAVTPQLLSVLITEIDAGMQRMRAHYGWD